MVCDDEAVVTEAYRRILQDLTGAQEPAGDDGFDALSAELFGDGQPVARQDVRAVFNDIVYCQQGAEAVAAFADAHSQGQPFAAVFLDVRMPPGMNGVEAAKRIRAIDPTVNIVMVTGYSDIRPSELADIIGANDRLFYLVKPFNPDEVRQLATTLANRWTTDVLAAGQLSERLVELEILNQTLQAREAHAHTVARHDPLTGLLNRKGLLEQFNAASIEASEAGKVMALLYIDLDRFKLVNDTHGHGIGDELISKVALQISNLLTGNELAARLGGDEFAVVCKDDSRLDGLLGHLLALADLPFVIGTQQLPVTLSIGLTKFEPLKIDLGEAMRQADIALYSAKANGRNAAKVFSLALDEEFLRSQRLAEDLKRAIQNDQLMLHYQPPMSADGKTVTGVEALLRWVHPEHGSLSPAVFVAIAEQTDLISELGNWVLNRAFEDSLLWPDVMTSINLSAAQFRKPAFAEHVLALANSIGISVQMVEFEITETALSPNMDNFRHQVETLEQAGFKFALDDFGSGFASIGYLNQLRFSKLKIDRSFISDIREKPNAEKMIRSIVSLAGAMDLTVTAEGVEQDYQHDILLAAGCDQMQGYLFHKPGPRDVVQSILMEQRRLA